MYACVVSEVSKSRYGDSCPILSVLLESCAFGLRAPGTCSLVDWMVSSTSPWVEPHAHVRCMTIPLDYKPAAWVAGRDRSLQYTEVKTIKTIYIYIIYTRLCLKLPSPGKAKLLALVICFNIFSHNQAKNYTAGVVPSQRVAQQSAAEAAKAFRSHVE